MFRHGCIERKIIECQTVAELTALEDQYMSNESLTRVSVREDAYWFQDPWLTRKNFWIIMENEDL